MITRFDLLRDRFSGLDLDAILITSATSHRYFTGFNNPDGMILVTENSIYAFEDFRYTEVATSMLGNFCSVIAPKSSFYEEINEALIKENIGKLGIEGNSVTLLQYNKMKSIFKCELLDIGSTVEKMRAIKSEREISLIREAQKITDSAYSYILGILSPKMTENDVACELEYFMRKNGAEDKSFETIAVSGKKSSLPHGVPSNTRLEKGFLTMDFGATFDGYHADMTRTVSIGKADEKMIEIYDTVLKAQLSALECLRVGITGADADRVAREIIDKKFKGAFGHSLGHGVGLEIHESPTLSYRNDFPLETGNVVTVEPGIYIPNFGGVRIEDLVVIRESGCENLTSSAKELIEIY
jgi:Xaa-Pro aminopeptidase